MPKTASLARTIFMGALDDTDAVTDADAYSDRERRQIGLAIVTVLRETLRSAQGTN
ncbi:MAG: hypothetical protein P8Y52_09130 [Xanthomonadales bacterium]